MHKKALVAVIVLNWNDANLLEQSVGSLFRQTLPCDIIVVDNGSTDNSKEVIDSFGTKVTALWNSKNLGFAGGINTGIRYANKHGYDYIALLNNDAVADKDWLEHLYIACSAEKKIGAATSAMIQAKDKTYDSTGDFYTIWGLAYPRGRDEVASGQYDNQLEIMSASGGASIFKSALFKDIGYFDEDFFAYYEDVDLGLRAQTRGWKFVFAPRAKVLHARGTTSGRVKNFGTYQGLKNQPLLLIKNMPLGLYFRILPRFSLAYVLFTLRALSRGHLLTVLKVWLVLIWLIPKKWFERFKIQSRRVPNASHILEKKLVFDLPESATELRKFRSIIRKVFPRFV